MQTYKKIVVLTGAGISAESGLKTFRDNNGLWEGHKVEEVATPEAYQQNPVLVHQFYNMRREQLLNGAKPNKAHFALAELEKAYPGSFTLVTQNVDNLHEQAGSKKLLHMHGELLKVRCEHCESIFHIAQTPESLPIKLETSTQCPSCHSTGTVRPHIVWFGEIPLHMDEIERVLCQCDLFLSIGTSGNVYPAAGFVQLAKRFGAHCVELNLEESQVGSLFDEGHYGNATDKVPAYVNTLLNL